MLIYGDTLESQGFSFFTEVKISTTFEIEKEEGRNFELLSAPDAIKKNSRLINKAVIKAK